MRNVKKSVNLISTITIDRRIHYIQQILQAVSKKVSVSTSVEWDYFAEATEGYSGADLQALIYNAHLEVVHSSTSDRALADTAVKNGASVENDDVEFLLISGESKNTVASRA